MKATTIGRSLELYFIDGKPDGLLTAEVFNWTGHVLMTPRMRLPDALLRKEAGYTGIYLLLGETEHGPRVYIGEGEIISERIRNHDAQKDWWTTAVLVTSMANNLNKAHVRYLEARLVQEAKAAGSAGLENSITPTSASLTEAGQANMEAFLGYLFMVLPALGVRLFVKNTRPAVTPEQTAPVFTLSLPQLGLTAHAVLNENEFIVLKGSRARETWGSENVEYLGYARLHAQLKATGVLKDEGGHCVFTQSYAFRNPSAAASIVSGSFMRGPANWKLRDGTTYRQWEEAQLSAGPPA